MKTFCWFCHALEHVYTTSKVKNHQKIILETVSIYDFLQKNNKFVISYPRSVKPIRLPFDTFVKILPCPVYTNPYFEVHP